MNDLLKESEDENDIESYKTNYQSSKKGEEKKSNQTPKIHKNQSDFNLQFTCQQSEQIFTE